MKNYDRITVIIPEHNRPNHLNRLLDYYLSQDVKIIVADSSKVEFCYLNEYKDKILYKHYPEKPLAEKIYNILPCIDTPYVVMCANDDFLIPETVQHIINFLDEHDDYNSGQGIYGLFDPLEKSIPLRLLYQHMLNDKIDEDNAADRVMHLMANYFQYYYAVYRTAVFQETYSSVIQNQKTTLHNLTLLESYISMYPAIMGKHIIINELYAVREYNIQSIGKCLDNMSVIKSDLKYKDEYNCYINLLSNKLLTIDNCSYQIAEKIITDSVDRYMMSNFTFSNRQLVKKILKKYTNLLKIIYKLFVKDAQHKNKLTGIMKCLIFIMNLFIVRIFTFWIRLLIMPSVKDIHHKNKLKLNMFPEFIPAYEKWTIVRNFILKYYNQCY